MGSWLGDPTNDAVTAIALLAVLLVPLCARIASAQARRESGRRGRRAKLLKAEGQSVRSVAGGLEAQDRLTQRRRRVALVRSARRRSIRRRRLSTILLLLLAAILLAFSFVFTYSPWIALVPLAALLCVLCEGIVAARRARLFEKNLRKHPQAGRMRRRLAVTSSLTTPPAGEGPQSRPIRSVRRVAHAVPLTGRARERVLEDVTPSTPLRSLQKREESTGSATPAHGGGATGGKRVQEKARPKPLKKPAPHGSGGEGVSARTSSQRSGESLSTDVSTILARRNR